VYDWYAANQQYLINRRPLAAVGIVYSQDNADFYGRDNAGELVSLPYYGVVHTLVRARIPYIPVHADHIDRDSAGLSLLILPNLAAMSDNQVAAVRRFVERGGGLLATGESSLRNEWGQSRGDFALSDLLGVHHTGKTAGSLGEAESWTGSDHTYLRLLPDIGKEVYGPRAGHEPVVSGKRHAVLKGFEQTDIIAFGGLLQEVRAEPDTTVPVTFIPDFPAYPPETSWMRTPRTDTPALVLKEGGNRGRCAYFAADIDRRYARDYLPDHATLLANVIRWAAHDKILLEVKGGGLIDCHLYRQQNRLILHLVNQTSAETWRAPVHELIPVGPLEVSVQIPRDLTASGSRLLVGGQTLALARVGNWGRFTVASVVDHEVAIIE
jgi:hypothetical protein